MYTGDGLALQYHIAAWPELLPHRFRCTLHRQVSTLTQLLHLHHMYYSGVLTSLHRYFEIKLKYIYMYTISVLVIQSWMFRLSIFTWHSSINFEALKLLFSIVVLIVVSWLVLVSLELDTCDVVELVDSLKHSSTSL